MPSNIYTDEGPAQEPSEAPMEESSSTSEDKGTPSAVIPLSIAGEGVKPGDEIKVRVVRVTEDSVVVEPCDYEESPREEEAEPESEPETRGGMGMSSVMD